MMKTKEQGGHSYDEHGTSDCHFGCGCWAGDTRSGGPDGVDPLGMCPKNPGGRLTTMDDEKIRQRLEEQLANCDLCISVTRGEEKQGWEEDAAYYRALLALLEENKRLKSVRI